MFEHPISPYRLRADGAARGVRRWTPLSFLAPRRYIDEDPFWETFDFEAWSRSAYTWTGDAWNGFRDLARRPRETVDREDYALVAISWTDDSRYGFVLRRRVR